MLVVSDSTPLNILVRTEMIDLLPSLFGRVVVPPAVAAELSHPNTPGICRDWIVHPPAWLEVHSPSQVDSSLARDPGECEAICLAKELRADLLLVDDKEARQAAARAGLAITGTLGVLELAANRGLVRLSIALEKIRSTDFYISEKLIRNALARHKE